MGISEELGLLGGAHLSLDGLKLPSYASKKQSGIFKDLKMKCAKFKGKIKDLICEYR